MKRWEYKVERVVSVPGAESAMSLLNRMGAQGWELVQAPQSSLTTAFYFKREIGAATEGDDG